MRAASLFSAIIVLLAVALMVGLGIWQLQRMEQKDKLITRYRAAQDSKVIVEWGKGDDLYRRTRVHCVAVRDHGAMAGRNAQGEAGLAQTVQCQLADGRAVLVVLGWSLQPHNQHPWQGGTVEGVIAPGPRLVADPVVGGLVANAIPDPADLPNNHFAYAVQWFLFAGTALVIYFLASRRKKTRT